MINIHSYPETVVETKNVRYKVIVHTEDNTTSTFVPSDITTIKIFEPGKPGPTGQKGDRGFDGTSRPFFQVSEIPLVFATTASIQLYDISSSLLPYTGSIYNTTFNIGSSTRPWKKIYTSHDGIFFVNENTGANTTLYAGDGYIGIGKSRLSSTGAEITGSVKLKSSGSSDVLSIYSGSTIRIRANKDGIMVFESIHPAPIPISGGVLYSGSNFFFGM